MKKTPIFVGASVVIVGIAFLGLRSSDPSGRPVPTPSGVISAISAKETAKILHRGVSEIDRDPAMMSAEPKALQELYRARSSFVDTDLVSALGLSDEEAMALEIVLRSARSRVFSEIVANSKVSEDSPGVIEIGYEPSEVSAFEALEDHVYSAIMEILGEGRFRLFLDLQDIPAFETKFNYFGRYPQRIRIGLNGSSIANARFVTVASTTSGVPVGPFGRLFRMTRLSTSVFERIEFERDFVQLSKLTPDGD